MSGRQEGWLWLGRRIGGRPWLILLPLLSGAASLLLTLPALWLMRFALDQNHLREGAGLLFAAGAGILLSRGLESAVVVMMMRLTAPHSRRVVASMRAELHGRLLRWPWTDYGGINRSQLHARLVHDTERVEQWVGAVVSSGLPVVVPLLFYTGLLFWISWPLALVVLVAAPLSRLLQWYSAMFQQRAIRVFQKRFEDFHVGASKSLRMLPATRAQGVNAHDVAVFERLVDRLARSGEQLSLGGAISQQANALASSFVIVTVLVAGGLAVINNVISIGVLAVFVFVASLVSAAIGALGTTIPLAMAADESLKRLVALRAHPTLDDDSGILPSTAPAVLTFEGVSFAYADRRVVDRQSLRLEYGATTAIAAANGSGKTTLLELTLGLLKPTEGRVLVDGVDLSEMNLGAWRRSLGYVPQHPLFFRGSLRENICHGQDHVDPLALEEAVHASGLDVILDRFPDGLDAPVGDDGLMLSGGELQRVAIARALVGSPTLLVIDEPTNHLDAAAVELLAERIFARGGRTILMATHDQRLLALADHVYDMADGVLSRRGAPSHREIA